MLSRVARLVLALPLCFALVAGELAHADPPGRVGRLALTEGLVMLHNAGLERWEDAILNWPLTSGDILHTGPDGRAEMRVGSTTLRLDGNTEMRIQQLDDERFHVWLEHGSVALRLRSRDPADRVTIETRDGRALVGEPGRYRVDYAHATTHVTAERGQLQFLADDRHLSVPEGQRAAIWFAGGTQHSWGEPARDDFFEWVLARDRHDDSLGAPRYVSPEMTGAEDLAVHGDWRQVPDYGPAWYPRQVPNDWVPYRHGRWVWVEPWGWTWLDAAPWGFAPFHYGRWVMIGARWAWVPGSYVARPVYAPALVAWIGSSGWSVGFSSGHLPAVGWFPLGPRDVFVPKFRASPTFVRKVNIVHVTNVTHITQVVRDPRRARFTHRHHRHAVTVVPVDAFARGRPVDRSALRDPQRWVRDAPIATALPGFERRSTDAQARERSARFELQRQRRLEEDQSRRAERRRAFEPGAAPGHRQSVESAVRPQPRTRPEAASRGRELQSGRAGQPGEQLRQTVPARQWQLRGGEAVRERETVRDFPGMQRPGTPQRIQRLGERERVIQQFGPAQRPPRSEARARGEAAETVRESQAAQDRRRSGAIQRRPPSVATQPGEQRSEALERPGVTQRGQQRPEGTQRGQRRPEGTWRGHQRPEGVERGQRSSAAPPAVERPRWSGQRDDTRLRGRGSLQGSQAGRLDQERQVGQIRRRGADATQRPPHWGGAGAMREPRDPARFERSAREQDRVWRRDDMQHGRSDRVRQRSEFRNRSQEARQPGATRQGRDLEPGASMGTRRSERRR